LVRSKVEFLTGGWCIAEATRIVALHMRIQASITPKPRGTSHPIRQWWISNKHKIEFDETYAWDKSPTQQSHGGAQYISPGYRCVARDLNPENITSNTPKPGTPHLL